MSGGPLGLTRDPFKREPHWLYLTGGPFVRGPLDLRGGPFHMGPLFQGAP